MRLLKRHVAMNGRTKTPQPNSSVLSNIQNDIPIHKTHGRISTAMAPHIAQKNKYLRRRMPSTGQGLVQMPEKKLASMPSTHWARMMLGKATPKSSMRLMPW